MIINSTDAVVLARALLAWWDETPNALLCEQLAIKEPFPIREARAVLERNRNRLIVTVKPGDRPHLVALGERGEL